MDTFKGLGKSLTYDVALFSPGPFIVVLSKESLYG